MEKSSSPDMKSYKFSELPKSMQVKIVERVAKARGGSKVSPRKPVKLPVPTPGV